MYTDKEKILKENVNVYNINKDNINNKLLFSYSLLKIVYSNS